jgi:hypothetical protein
VIQFVIWSGTWHGRRWAYILDIVLMSVSLSVQFSNLQSAANPVGVGLLVCLFKVIFLALRLGGNVGPPLK